MNALLLTVFIPLVGGLLLAVVRPLRVAGWLNLAFCLASFIASLFLAEQVLQHGELVGYTFHVDAFNVFLVVLTAFVGFTTAIFSPLYGPRLPGRLGE